MTAELLHNAAEGLFELTVTAGHPSTHRKYNELLPHIHIPIACLSIPNKFFLWLTKYDAWRRR